MKLFNKILISFGAILLLVFLILFGYSGYIHHRPIPGPGNEPLITVFKSDFIFSVERMASDFGSIRRSKFEINSDYDEVCFLKTKGVILKENSQEKYSFNVSLMDVESDFCLKPDNKKIELRIEGMGDHSKVSVWS